MATKMTEFEEWRVEQACKLIRRCEADLARVLSDGERRDLLMDNTHWTREQIVDAVSADRLSIRRRAFTRRSISAVTMRVSCTRVERRRLTSARRGKSAARPPRHISRATA